MTTIAYHHESKIIAWESRQTQEGLIRTDKCMKMKEKDGVRFWVAGAVPDELKLIDKYFGADIDGLIECNAFVYDGKTLNYVGVTESGEFWSMPIDYNCAMGSGEFFALAAMDFGKSAVEAVEYAKTRDCYSGGEVHDFCIDGKE